VDEEDLRIANTDDIHPGGNPLSISRFVRKH
jgi:hypothetical protein